MQPLQLFDVVRIREDRDETDWLVIGISLRDEHEIVPKKPIDRSKTKTRLVVRLKSLNLKLNRTINKYIEAVSKATEGLEVALTHKDENIRKSCKQWLETANRKEVE